MARTECKDCGGPIGKSHSAAYCRDCHNKRQRQYARKRAAERGLDVKARIRDDDAQQRLMDAGGKPGLCHLCNEREEHALVLLYETGDHTVVPSLLACQPCDDLLKKVDEAVWARLHAIMVTLTKRGVRLRDLTIG